MYVVIVGCSAVGYHLLKGLLASGHEVVVIETNEDRCQLLYDELGSIVIRGDGTDQNVLEAAGAARSDMLIATTGIDQTNLIACQTAKQIFNVARTATIVTDTKNEPLFHILGVDVVVNSTHLAVTQLEATVPGKPLIRLMDLNAQNTELVNIAIPEDASVIGQRLSDIQMPGNSFVSLIVRKDSATIASPNSIIEAHDEIIAITTLEDEHLLYETLTGV